MASRFALSIGLLAATLFPPQWPAEDRKEALSTSDKSVTVYGSKIHYVEAGNGAPLILIHGLADNIECGIR